VGQEGLEETPTRLEG